MAKVDLVDPRPVEKNVVITLSWAEAKQMREILGDATKLGEIYDELVDLDLGD